ncbi:hypothetical protein [Methanolobus sp. WCC5]|uniref:hypothetical protein n=1 Tax=Methanolobus sp. WCC5 TaxID=3125785 RepID=UPI0032488EDD
MEEITKGPTTEEILEAQLQIAESKVVELQGSNAGLQAQIDELTKLIMENTTAQTVLSTAAAELSTVIDTKQDKMLEMPAGLNATEIAGLRAARQAEIDELKQKQDKYKAYIRGEI